MKKILICILFLCFVSGAFSQTSNDFPLWLLGVWEISSETGSSFEMWNKTNDKELTGKTFRIFYNDTVVFDTMRINYFNSEIVYQMSANVKNTRTYARFSLQRPDPVLWKFENPLTDYPRNINYMRMGNDSVYVWTEASNADNSCMDYLMIRHKDE